MATTTKKKKVKKQSHSKSGYTASNPVKQFFPFNGKRIEFDHTAYFNIEVFAGKIVKTVYSGIRDPKSAIRFYETAVKPAKSYKKRFVMFYQGQRSILGTAA